MNANLQPAIFALRYEVYCLERGFLDPSRYHDGLESDEYDSRAAHFTAHNRHNELVGSLRLVHPPLSETFPFENHCYELFDDAVLPPREQSAEISRLVVRKSYRARAGTGYGKSSPEEFSITGPIGAAPQLATGEQCSRYSSEILLGLYRQIYQYSVAREIRYWYAAMERSLARALTRLEVFFKPIGRETDYYGPVTPYLIDLRDLERRLATVSPDALAWFRGYS